jgi:hypothetical protein
MSARGAQDDVVLADSGGQALQGGDDVGLAEIGRLLLTQPPAQPLAGEGAHHPLETVGRLFRETDGG